MTWFSNLKTATKLLVGFGLVFVFSAAEILVSYRGISGIRESQHTFLSGEFASIATLSDLRAGQYLQRAELLAMLLSTDKAEQEALQLSIQGQQKTESTLLERLAQEQQDDVRFLLKFGELRTTLAAFNLAQETIFKLILDGRTAEAALMAKGVQTERFEKVRSLSQELSSGEQKQADGRQMLIDEATDRSIRWSLIMGLSALTTGLGLIMMLHQSIARPLREIMDVAARISMGELTVKLSAAARPEEVGMLAQTFSRMTSNLREQNRQLIESANALASSASQIVAASSQMAASATESAVAVSETTTTVNEVRQTALVAGQKAEAVAGNAQQAAQNARNGRKSTEDVVVGMTQIRLQMEAIAASMVRLSEQGQTIGQIIATVDDLAAQSNLLAVNAAIEAAKAGEHGKGFGVVAQEVKSLAEQSRQATSQVRTILGDIQKATTAAVMATEQGSKAVAEGEQQTAEAGESIEALAGSAVEAAQAAMQIAASGQQQLVGVDQVAAAMMNIKLASTQNVASAKQLETAAHDLNDLGARLKQMVEKYKV